MSKLDSYMIDGFLPTIGIECHVQFKTKTKLFAGVSNDARGAAPNTLISHICLGMPGALPVLNEQAVELGARAAFALNTTPQLFSKFDRKHYFYPDLPKGYQITQFDQPIILGGYVEIEVDGQDRKIGITRAHLEEDAGKSTHPEGADYSLVDLNRAGTPLLEVVSEPEIHSGREAKAYAQELHLLMRYANVSEANLYHGNMRFDVNVSVSRDLKQFGTRTETKNLNSFKSVEKAVDYEIKRQIELIKKGEVIVQETRGWNDSKQVTFSQRTKEEAHDYRYFPEPDLPPVVIDEAMVERIKNTMPVMPGVLRKKLAALGLDSSAVETIVSEQPAGVFMLDLLNKVDAPAAKRIANWLASDVQGLVADEQATWETAQLDIDSFVELEKLVSSKQINSTAAKTILTELIRSGGNPLTIAQERDLLQVSDKDSIQAIVEQVIAAHPQAAEDVKNGEMKAIGFLVGQIMKESKGKANPGLAQQLIKKYLGV